MVKIFKDLFSRGIRHFCHYHNGIIRRFTAVSFPLLLLNPLSVAAQDSSPWILGLYTHGFHTLTGNVLGIAQMLVNVPIASATDGMVSADFVPYTFHYMSMEDNGEKVDNDIDPYSTYRLTSYNLFKDVEIGLKFGWQGAESIIGAYAYGAYCINQYKIRFLGEHEYNKHKIQSWKAGVGVRISPLRFLMDEYDWCPVFELGTNYVYNFKYKGPNDSDIDQLNNGLRSTYAIGAQIGEGGSSIMLCMDMAHYDLFNKNYTPDGGFWYPYANFKSHDMYFSLKFSLSIEDL